MTSSQGDQHPTFSKESSLTTDPPVRTTAVFRKQPAIFSQLGRATSYTSNGDSFSTTSKPSYYQLAAWDEARRKEPLIKRSLDIITLAILSKIGPYSHPDSQIDEFVQANLENKLSRWIKDLTTSLLWSGMGVSEILWQLKQGPNGTQVWIEDMVNYHPLQVNILLNQYGRVKDGEPVANSSLKSGIWVPVPMQSNVKKNAEYMGNLIRLPKGKRVYLTLGGEGNNPFGKSILESVFPYHLFKEAFREMMTVALDRYGTPLIYAIVPPLDTKETVEEPDGRIRAKTLQELTAEQMQNLSAESALVFTQISKDQPVQVEALTTGNNFSDSFERAIDLCDRNILVGMGVPNLLIRDNSNTLGTSGASDSQAELFDNLIGSYYDLILQPFLEQAILQLIQYNFDPRKNPGAFHPGTIKKRPTRIAELEVTVKAIKELTELQFLSPYNELDFNYVRDLLHLPERAPEPKPKEPVVAVTALSSQEKNPTQTKKKTGSKPLPETKSGI